MLQLATCASAFPVLCIYSPYWWHVVGARHVGSRHLSLHSCDQHSCELFDIHDGTSVPPRVFVFCYPFKRASLVTQTLKNLPAMQKTQVRSLAWEDDLEKGMATQSSILAWRILWTEETGGLQTMGLQRIRQDCVTNTHSI